MKTRIIDRIFTVVFFITTGVSVWAEPLPTPTPSFFPVNPDGGDDPDTPINQIAIWLLVTGVLLVAYYLRKMRNKIQVRE